MTHLAQGKLISSIQYTTADLTDSETSTTSATFTAVDASRSIILPAGWTVTETDGDSRHQLIQWRFTTSTPTDIAVARYEHAGKEINSAGFFIVEFSVNAVKYCKQGYLDTTWASNDTRTDTVALTNTSNAMLLLNGQIGGLPYTGGTYHYVHGVITNTTTLTFSRRYSGGTTGPTVSYTCIEFY